MIIVLYILVLNLPVAFAASESAASTVNTAGFWVGFTLLVITSLVEAVLSILWTRIRITSDGTRPCEISCRVCGREISLSAIDPNTAAKIAEDGLPVGFYTGTQSSVSYSSDFSHQKYGSAHGCSTCGGFERKHSSVVDGASEVAIDKFGSIMLLATLIIRRFNPSTSLHAPTGLLDNVRVFFRPGKYSIGRLLENVIHLMVGLVDVSLGVAGLILNPGSPQALYDTLKDPRAPITFENYSTLFLLYWFLGALLALCMIPMRSSRRSVQMFGWPGVIAFAVASLASLVLFAVGCWKIDVARREHSPWTPMLSYWIGGASAISFPLFGIEVFHTFGVVGLVFMMMHTF